MRIQAFEFCDQTWLPSSWRFQMMYALTYFLERTQCYRHFNLLFLKHVCKFVNENQSPHHDIKILELCSGALGPTRELARAVKENHNQNVKIIASDKFPLTVPENQSSDFSIKYFEQPIDALSRFDIGEDARVLYTALHHFVPRDVELLINNAMQAHKVFATAEFTQRRISQSASLLLSPFVLALASVSRSAGRANLLAKILSWPLLSLMFFWDGVVSSLRSYHPEELYDLARSAGASHHQILVGSYKAGILGPVVTYLIVNPPKIDARS